MGALAVVSAARGLTLSQLALRVGVDPELLARADAGDQALPISVAEQIAAALQLDLGTVLRAAGEVNLERGNPSALRPLPRTIGLVGRPPPLVPATSVAKTRPVVPPAPPRELLWVGFHDDEGGHLRIYDVETGAQLYQLGPLQIGDQLVAPIALATDGKRVYAACLGAFFDGPGGVIAFDAETQEQLWSAGDEVLGFSVGIAYDPALEVLWVAAGGAVAKLTTAGTLVHWTDVFSGANMIAFDVVAGDGCAYLVGQALEDGSAMCRVDADTMAVVARSVRFGDKNGSIGLALVGGAPRAVVYDDGEAAATFVYTLDPSARGTGAPIDAELVDANFGHVSRVRTDGVGLYCATANSLEEVQLRRCEPGGFPAQTFGTDVEHPGDLPFSVALSRRYAFCGSVGEDGGGSITRMTLAGVDPASSDDGFFDVQGGSPYSLLVVRRPDFFLEQNVSRIVV